MSNRMMRFKSGLMFWVEQLSCQALGKLCRFAGNNRGLPRLNSIALPCFAADTVRPLFSGALLLLRDAYQMRFREIDPDASLASRWRSSAGTNIVAWY
jgi:hypothetical protein